MDVKVKGHRILERVEGVLRGRQVKVRDRGEVLRTDCFRSGEGCVLLDFDFEIRE